MLDDIKARAAKALQAATADLEESSRRGHTVPLFEPARSRYLAGAVVEALLGPDDVAEEVPTVAAGGDPVNPAHYKGDDVMQIIERYTLGFCTGNVIKYVLRHGAKAGLVDLKKARWYLDRVIGLMEKEGSR